MAGVRPDTIAEHDRKVLLDAARLLETAARKTRKLANLDVKPVADNEIASLVVEIHACINAAQARLS